MLPRDQLIPEPVRSLAELTELGRAHMARLRRRRLQAGIAIGVAIFVVAFAIPFALRETSIGDFQNIAPIGRSPARVTEDAPRIVEDGGRHGSPERLRTGPATSKNGADGGTATLGSRRVSRAGRIAFARRANDGSPDSNIFTMLPNATDVRQLTTGPAAELQPSWSPDGSRLVFASEAGNWDLVIGTADGQELRNVTRTPGSAEVDPAWSPDGRRIVFSRFDYSSETQTSEGSDLFVYDIGSERTTRLMHTPDIEEQSPAWSPDGSRIVFHRADFTAETYEPGLFVIKADGSGLRRLTKGADTDPAWSPNGRSIAFVRDANIGGDAPGGVKTTPADASSIYVVERDGSSIRRLTEDSKVIDHSPDWSPDGTKVIFTRDPDGYEDATLHWAGAPEGGPLSAIYLMNADGTQERALTDPSSGDFQAAWLRV